MSSVGMCRILDDLYQGPASAITAQMLVAESIEVVWSLVPVDFPVPTVCTLIADDAQGLPTDTLELLWAIANGLACFRVLTVCRAGENRSGLAAALILMVRGHPVETAIRQVQEYGPATTREYSLWNPGFLKNLRESPWNSWWPWKRFELPGDGCARSKALGVDLCEVANDER